MALAARNNYQRDYHRVRVTRLNIFLTMAVEETTEN